MAASVSSYHAAVAGVLLLLALAVVSASSTPAPEPASAPSPAPLAAGKPPQRDRTWCILTNMLRCGSLSCQRLCHEEAEHRLPAGSDDEYTAAGTGDDGEGKGRWLDCCCHCCPKKAACLKRRVLTSSRPVA
ncbi:hypothetical protein ACP70R_014714 [Stipagrostis hirtigluma subsp. patula]